MSFGLLYFEYIGYIILKVPSYTKYIVASKYISFRAYLAIAKFRYVDIQVDLASYRKNPSSASERVKNMVMHLSKEVSR